MKDNCWDFMNCGREIGGFAEDKLGNCAAITYISFNGTNGGFRSGRYCWYVAGSFQKESHDCICLSEIEDCSSCDFFKLVKKEEGEDFQS